MEGGTDTMSSFLQTLILAFVAFPETLKTAQKEIDAVVGEHRLPSIDDAAKLPYCRAIIKEAGGFEYQIFFLVLMT